MTPDEHALLSEMLDYLYELRGCWDWKEGVRAGGMGKEYQALQDTITKAEKLMEKSGAV